MLTGCEYVLDIAALILVREINKWYPRVSLNLKVVRAQGTVW
jgi:hypothetical protein